MTKETITNDSKPYDRCLDCSHLGVDCDGPNFLAMTLERWCEWCRKRKTHMNWTNDIISERSGVSRVTVDRIMAGNTNDVRMSTMKLITAALVNGTWGQFPCAGLHTQEEWESFHRQNAELRTELDRLHDALSRIHDSYAVEIQTIRDEAQRKIDFLKAESARKDKLIDRLMG